MIKLKKQETEEEPVEYKPPKIFIGQLYTGEPGNWQKADWKTVLNVPLSEIIAGAIRFVMELTIDGSQMFLCSHTEDAAATHKKHPGKAVVHIKQLYKFMSEALTDDRWRELLPKVFVFLNEFPGAEVVK